MTNEQYIEYLERQVAVAQEYIIGKISLDTVAQVVAEAGDEAPADGPFSHAHLKAMSEEFENTTLAKLRECRLMDDYQLSRDKVRERTVEV